VTGSSPPTLRRLRPPRLGLPAEAPVAGEVNMLGVRTVHFRVGLKKISVISGQKNPAHDHPTGRVRPRFSGRARAKKIFAGFKISAHTRPVRLVGGPGAGRARAGSGRTQNAQVYSASTPSALQEADSGVAPRRLQSLLIRGGRASDVHVSLVTNGGQGSTPAIAEVGGSASEQQGERFAAV
jgi:hypothetical protein